MIRAFAFVAVFTVLQFGWQAIRGTAIESVVVDDATVRPAAFLVRALTPAIPAHAVGSTLEVPGGGLRIANGCEGTETLFLLVAGFAVAPLGWRLRLTGLAWGTLVVFVVNEARIVALFYASRHDPALFSLLHETVLPIVAVLMIFAFFHAWLVHASRRTASP